MNIKILKFGGTSLENIGRFAAASEIIKKNVQSHSKLIIVVSAIAGHTNNIISKITSFAGSYNVHNKEYDVALHTGEILSASLMASYLTSIGIKSQSVCGWQIPIITDNNFSNAQIIEMKQGLLLSLLNQNIIPIVTGFQGITRNNEITTLGRSGSDTSAAYLAYIFRAKTCDIYTDVEGVYSADPRIIKNAKKIRTISYEEMLEIAGLGAKVITARAIRLAYRGNFVINIRSSFNKNSGTKIMNKSQIMEKNHITSITSNANIAVIYLHEAYKQNLTIAVMLANQNIQILSVIYRENSTEIIINLNQYNQAEAILRHAIGNYSIRKNLALISVIGLGIKDDAAILGKILNYLKSINIKLHSLISSEFKISLLIDEENINSLLKTLHENLITHPGG